MSGGLLGACLQREQALIRQVQALVEYNIWGTNPNNNRNTYPINLHH